MALLRKWFSLFSVNFSGGALSSLPVTEISQQGAQTKTLAALSVSFSVQKGDFIAVGVGWFFDGTHTVSSVSDGTNTYTLRRSDSIGGGTDAAMSIYTATMSATNASLTLTVTMNAAPSNFAIQAVQFRAPIATNIQADGTTTEGTTVQLPTGFTPNVNDTIITFLYIQSSQTITATGGYTSNFVGDGTTFQVFVEWRIFTVVGSTMVAKITMAAAAPNAYSGIKFSSG